MESRVNPFPEDKFKTSKLKEFADDNYNFHENGRNFSLSHSVFKRLLLQTFTKQELFGKELRDGKNK